MALILEHPNIADIFDVKRDKIVGHGYFEIFDSTSFCLFFMGDFLPLASSGSTLWLKGLVFP